jgi:hypothetical protein
LPSRSCEPISRAVDSGSSVRRKRWHVYEVGRHGDQVFIAMERVAGSTLRTWCREPGRTWRDIVRVHVGAGEGLAAAHDAGLVHRDLQSLAVSALADGRFEEAADAAERALSIFENGCMPPERLAVAQFELARALWVADRDRPRAMALAAQARDAQRGVGEPTKNLTEIDAWLSDRAG